ncbi:MAG: VOC family protein [Desulfuromonadales bacterium]|nr:VOC family protein [Desulfuromonadales bacterium]NIR33365.1 VOC family protein [Desulfuromonadales bacterium]NIS39564.1 VOC family protein [Desulfuromonadales bacterium]
MEQRDKCRAVGINHVALEVGDIDAAIEFYASLIDLKLRGRKENAAFIDLGDQFIALFEKSDRQRPDTARHFGLVVDDREAFRELLDQHDVKLLDGGPGLDFLDPWGNHVQVVEYGGIQFTKAESVLRGMGLSDLEKTDEAIEELRRKGM